MQFTICSAAANPTVIIAALQMQYNTKKVNKVRGNIYAFDESEPNICFNQGETTSQFRPSGCRRIGNQCLYADSANGRRGRREPTPQAAAEEPAMAGDAANGEYIATLTGGCGCHFNSDLSAMAGGREFTGALGIVHASNYHLG